MAKKPLTEAQESRLIRHLDQQLLRLSGGLESRHSGPSARLPTLAAFLDEALALLDFISSIPSAPPSAALRTAYALQLTGYLPPALDGYTLLDDQLDPLFAALARFDQGWVAILEGRDWSSQRGAAEPASPSAPGAGISPAAASGVRTTDRVRLESLVTETKSTLATSLGLPDFVPLEHDPFQELLDPFAARPREPVRLEELRRPACGGGDLQYEGVEAGDEAAMEPESAGATPSLVSDGSHAGDGDEAMSVDTAVATPSDDAALDEDDEDGVDFEEVAAVSMDPSPLPSNRPHERLRGAYAEAAAADGSFSIHFTDIPPPTLQDGELSLQQGATPITGQRRGFDPDEEYPLSEEEGDPIGGNGVTGPGHENAREREDGIDDKTRDRVKSVFEQTERALARLRAQAAAAA
ncbi:uncharacterized protein JCM10292_007585 [Rhodotorula paludigena]|uniref:uncharacterized protein n=1 Tax=Rhodotorula paludigena TaxID=86838 RepID=UPI003175F731